MIVYEVEESISFEKTQEIFCCFCGKNILPHFEQDESPDFGVCEHLVYVCSTQTWQEPEHSSEDIFANYDDEGDEFHDDYLKRTLSDEYLMIVTCGPGISGLDGITIFKQKT